MSCTYILTKEARNNPFATLSATGIKKPIENQWVMCFKADRTVSSLLTQTPLQPPKSSDIKEL